MPRQLATKNRCDASARDNRDVDPRAEFVLVFMAADCRKPTAERCGEKHCRRHTRNQRCPKHGGMLQVHERDNDKNRRQCGEDSRIPAPAEPNIKHRTEHDRPEIRRHRGSRDNSDGCLGNMLRRQQLRHYEEGDTAIETYSGVRQTHQPDRRDALVELQADLQDSPMLYSFADITAQRCPDVAIVAGVGRTES